MSSSRPLGPVRLPPLRTPDRAVLADALAAAGPEAPTLCEGWTARDLAAHVVLRESRPDALASAVAGAAVGPLGRHAETVQQRTAERPFEELVATIRTGPPRWTPLAVPGLDAVANLVEFFVHTEDVRRAGSGWAPRALSGEHRAALDRALRRQARLLLRRVPVGVLLSVPGGRTTVARRAPAGAGSVTLVGQPEELLLRVLGRDRAQVEVHGTPADVAAFETAKLGM